jgi:hypothetical protein
MTTKKMSDFMNNEDISFENTVQQTEVSTGSHKKSGFSKKQKTILVMLGIIILILAGLYYRFNHSKASVEKRAQAETVRLVKEVRKIMILPETDVPAVFDVQDPTLLASQQAFFVGAEKGDKLLVYPQIGKAIIYSPKRQKIVNVGPVTFDQTKPASTTGSLQQNPAPSAPLTK